MTAGPLVHRWVAGPTPDAPVLVALHGSGRDERDGLALAARIAPDHAALAIRGPIRWGAGFANLRRGPDRRIAAADVDAAAALIGARLRALLARRAPGRAVTLAGFSNGAIMAAALSLSGELAPERLVLLRPLSPPTRRADVRRLTTRALLCVGRRDRRRAASDGAATARRLAHAGADVARIASAPGHGPTAAELTALAAWLRVGAETEAR